MLTGPASDISEKICMRKEAKRHTSLEREGNGISAKGGRLGETPPLEGGKMKGMPLRLMPITVQAGRLVDKQTL